MESLRDARILVVGGAGFVGSNLVHRLLPDAPREIVVVDNLLSAEARNVPDDPAVTFIEGSITADDVLARVEAPLDYVFHLATYHGNQSSVADPLADHENNTFTTLRLCEHLKTFPDLRKVIYASAGCTVAEKTWDEARATTEDAPVSLYLDSPYQISKIVGELYFNWYFTHHGIPSVKARFQNVYGPREILGAGRWRGTPHTVWRNVTPSFVYRGLKGLPLTVENEGRATRDFIFVDDLVEGLVACALRGEPGGVYNLATGVETSILELAHLVNELTGNPTPIEFLPPRPWDHSGTRYGSTEKARREIGFEARTPIREGLVRTVDWTRKNLEAIEVCMARHREHVPDLP